MVEWIVEVETADGVVADEAALDTLEARIRAAPQCSDCLVAYHPDRHSVAAWLRLSASDAADAARAAEAAMELALSNGKAPAAAPVVSINVRLDREV